jgi:DNA-binding CsgD family transcriptional regulator
MDRSEDDEFFALEAVPPKIKPWVEGEGCPLTPMQLRLLRMALMNGSRTKILSEKLGISPHTVDTHFRTIRRRIGNNKKGLPVTRGEAILLAVRQGWLLTTADVFASLTVDETDPWRR